jgi:opacity protein-like surface antigen
LLIRAATSGGDFQYRSNLRSDTDPNYESVARMLRGEDPQVTSQTLTAGTLSVFAGKNTAHRVTAVGGTSSRLIAVLSYYETAGVTFSSAERIGFYGRDH